MKIVTGTTNNFEILNITYTFLTVNMIKNCGIAFTIRIIGQFIVRSKRDSKVLKDTDQIMTSRFTNVDSLAANARVSL